MYAQLKPEGLIRLQAGVKPLLKMVGTVALKGRQSALSPLRGCVDIPGLAGVAPLPVVLAPLRGCPCGLYKLFMFIYLLLLFPRERGHPHPAFPELAAKLQKYL